MAWGVRREEDEGGRGRRGEWEKGSSYLVYRLSFRVAGCRVQVAGVSADLGFSTAGICENFFLIPIYNLATGDKISIQKSKISIHKSDLLLLLTTTHFPAFLIFCHTSSLSHGSGLFVHRWG